MSVNPLGGLTPQTNTSGSTNGATSSTSANQLPSNAASQLGESAFLTLLSAELQYQDPLQPMNNTQFVAELAQFSQLSAVTSQTSTLNQILSAVQQQGGSSIVSASQLIGKTVTTTTGQSGQVISVSSSSKGLSFDVSGVGSVAANDIQKVQGS